MLGSVTMLSSAQSVGLGGPEPEPGLVESTIKHLIVNKPKTASSREPKDCHSTELKTHRFEH